MNNKLLIVLVVVALVITGGLAFLYLSRNSTSSIVNINSQQNFPKVEYKGLALTYGYASIKELNKSTYTGTINDITFPQDGTSGFTNLTIATPTEKKDFSFDPATTLIWLNNSQAATEGKTEVKIYPIEELKSLLTKDTVVSMQFLKSDSDQFPTLDEVKLGSSDIKVSILVHSYLKEIK